MNKIYGIASEPNQEQKKEKITDYCNKNNLKLNEIFTDKRKRFRPGDTIIYSGLSDISIQQNPKILHDNIQGHILYQQVNVIIIA
jgi:hypothetical protein